MEKYDRMSIDGKVGFTEYNHRYTLIEEPDIRFKSVTSLLKNYAEPFDARANAEKVKANPRSEYFGLDVDEILAMWKASSERGTMLHDIGERLLRGEKVELPEDPRIEHLVNAIDWIKENGYEIAATEMLVYDDELRVAGLSDIVLKKDGEFMIYDFKFIKALYKKGFFDSYKRDYKKMKGPFKYLHDCNWIHYSIQLALYQTLTGEPARVKEKVLVIITPEGYELAPCYPMRVYWNENNELHAVYERWDKKWYVSAEDRLYEQKPDWISGL